MWLWPQFRSPLVWDVFAGRFDLSDNFGRVLVRGPDSGFRDAAAVLAKQRWKAMIYGMLAMGWRSSARHWQRYEKAALLLAGLSTPLVVSVHTVVSFDFAVAMIPGWHTTIFPPYFVAGAIYSGFAMVLTLMIPVRKFFGLEDVITMRNLNNMAKVHARNGPDRRLRVHVRGLLRLLQRGYLREVHDLEPHDGPLCAVLLCPDFV